MAKIKFSETGVENTLEILNVANKELDGTSSAFESAAAIIKGARGAEYMNIEYSWLSDLVTGVQDAITEQEQTISNKAEEIKAYNEEVGKLPWGKRFLATLGMGGVKVVEGMVEGGELLLDGFASIGGAVCGLFGNKEKQNEIGDWVKKDRVTSKFNEWYNGDGKLATLNKYSYMAANSTGASLIKGVGIGLDIMFVGLAGGTALGLSGAGVSTTVGASAAQAFGTNFVAAAFSQQTLFTSGVAGLLGIGSGTQTGLNRGKDYNAAFRQGLFNGAVSAGSVMLFTGGFQGLRGARAQAKLNKSFSNETSLSVVDDAPNKGKSGNDSPNSSNSSNSSSQNTADDPISQAEEQVRQAEEAVARANKECQRLQTEYENGNLSKPEYIQGLKNNHPDDAEGKLHAAKEFLQKLRNSSTTNNATPNGTQQPSASSTSTSTSSASNASSSYASDGFNAPVIQNNKSPITSIESRVLEAQQNVGMTGEQIIAAQNSRPMTGEQIMAARQNIGTSIPESGSPTNPVETIADSLKNNPSINPSTSPSTSPSTNPSTSLSTNPSTSLSTNPSTSPSTSPSTIGNNPIPQAKPNTPTNSLPFKEPEPVQLSGNILNMLNNTAPFGTNQLVTQAPFGTNQLVTSTNPIAEAIPNTASAALTTIGDTVPAALTILDTTPAALTIPDTATTALTIPDTTPATLTIPAAAPIIPTETTTALAPPPPKIPTTTSTPSSGNPLINFGYVKQPIGPTPPGGTPSGGGGTPTPPSPTPPEVTPTPSSIPPGGTPTPPSSIPPSGNSVPLIPTSTNNPSTTTSIPPEEIVNTPEILTSVQKINSTPTVTNTNSTSIPNTSYENDSIDPLKYVVPAALGAATIGAAIKVGQELSDNDDKKEEDNKNKKEKNKGEVNYEE